MTKEKKKEVYIFDATSTYVFKIKKGFKQRYCKSFIFAYILILEYQTVFLHKVCITIQKKDIKASSTIKGIVKE